MPVMEKEKSALSAEEILKSASKIQKNLEEDKAFSENLTKFLDENQEHINAPITIGATPNSLALAGADEKLPVIINPETIIKCMGNPDQIYHGHNLYKEIMEQLPSELRNPSLILKGSNKGSLVAVTELKDKENREIIVSVELESKKGRQEVNRITSAYGRNNFAAYLDRQINEQNNLIAYNKEKADKMFQSLGLQLPPEETLISFDNSIAYTTANVKYPEKNILESTQFHSPVEHEKLLPFLNAKAQFHETRLNTLKDKRDTRTAKIEKNEAKIEKLSAKADKLEDMNELLSTLAKINPVVKAFTDRNADKIKAIREEKIPAREAKISAHKTRIAEIDKKSDVIGHKLERCVALSDTVKSFAIIGTERRQAFAQSMDKLNKATFDCISDKRAIVIEQQQQLISQLNKNIDQIGDNTPAENLRQMQEQLKAIQPRLAKLDSKLAKLKLPENAYVSKTAEHIDKIIDNTQKTVMESMENGSVSIPKLSENICESNAELSKQLEIGSSEKDNPFEYLKNAEMAMEDDYNSIDGIINNGKRNEQTEVTDNGADKISAEEIAANMPEQKRREIETQIEPSEIKAEQSQKEQASINAWHQLGDAYMEAYEERQISSYTKDGKPVIASQTRTADNVIENVRSAELSHKSEIKAENWLNTMITDGKAVIKDDGSFKINSDYYKNLPRNDRHIEEFSNDEALKIMNDLAEKNVQFSAVTRSDDKVAITVSQKDVGELTDIIDKLSFSQNDKENTVREAEKNNTVNPDYYKSLAASDRKTMTLSPSQAKEVMNRLSEKHIPYSASVRGSVTKLTVSKENEATANGILKSFNSKYINPDFYKSLSKDERYTQRMDSKQAKEIVSELAKNGVDHSAVIDGEKSAVTIRQSDYPKAKRFFMTHNKLQQVVNNTQQKQAQKDRENRRADPKKKRSGIE